MKRKSRMPEAEQIAIEALIAASKMDPVVEGNCYYCKRIVPRHMANKNPNAHHYHCWWVKVHRFLASYKDAR